MYVKFINENTIEKAPRAIFDEDKVYANPSPETLVAHGYLPFVDTERPVEEGYYFTFHYETDGESVTKVWDAHEIPVEPEIIEEPVEESAQEEEPETEEVKDESQE